jgi:hypothetical protein
MWRGEFVRSFQENSATGTEVSDLDWALPTVSSVQALQRYSTMVSLRAVESTTTPFIGSNTMAHVLL